MNGKQWRISYQLLWHVFPLLCYSNGVKRKSGQCEIHALFSHLQIHRTFLTVGGPKWYVRYEVDDIVSIIATTFTRLSSIVNQLEVPQTEKRTHADTDTNAPALSQKRTKTESTTDKG